MIRILQGDCRDMLRTLPDESVHCLVTSPPYWGLRDYGVAGQIGLEADYTDYVSNMVEVFREVRRVLRSDGTLWLNLGDSYAGSWSGNSIRPNGGQQRDGVPGFQPLSDGRYFSRNGNTSGLKPKDLCGIPWRVAFALQADGWWLRQDIIWSKPNPMPESVRDRCTKSHEYLFLLSKSERYFYDAEAIAESAVAPGVRVATPYTTHALGSQSTTAYNGNPRETRNRRSVWEVATQPFAEAHFATFPPALIEPCIKAGTSEKGCCAKCGAPHIRETKCTAMVIDRSNRTHDLGRTRSSGTMLEPAHCYTSGWSPSCSCNAAVVPCTVLDPFGGAGTAGLVADRLQRNAILIELNREYAAMAEHRIHGDAPLFAEVNCGAEA